MPGADGHAEHVAALQRLARAAATDGARGAEAVLVNALNAALVLCGVRVAARMDDSTHPGPAFMRALSATGLRLVEWGGRASEPLVVRASSWPPSPRAAIDLATVVQSRGSDLEQPVVGAMGRLLGYRCAYEASARSNRTWNARGIASLMAVVQALRSDGGGPLHELQLAGFGCGRSVPAARAAAVFRRMTAEWAQAATRALGGATVRLPGTSAHPAYLVVGFHISTSSIA